jgi:putative acetyltransferase
MIHCVRTDSNNPDFRTLVDQLDAELAHRDGAEHSFYAQFNALTAIRHVIVAYLGNEAAGCGAIKAFTSDTMEVKRMFVPVRFRGNAIASTILKELEQWAIELGYSKCVLETGRRQPEAIALYKKNGYLGIPNYGQYAGVENSICFEKKLTS